MAKRAFAGSGDEDDDAKIDEPATKKKAGASVVVLGESNVPMQEVGYTQFRDATSANVEEAEAYDLAGDGTTHLLEMLHPNTSGVERLRPCSTTSGSPCSARCAKRTWT